MFVRLLSLLLLTSVCFAGSPSELDSTGRHSVISVRNAYSSTNVTTSAWVQLVAAMPIKATKMEIFDSSGQTLKIGFGASGSEVTQVIVFPGGNGMTSILVPQDTRVSIKAITGTASSGESDINFYE